MKASDIVNLAISYIGTKECPANSNNVIFNTDYYNKEVSGSAYPWCCAFVWDMFRMAGASDLFYGGNKTAYCPALENYAKANDQWITNGYRPGDCVLFNWSGGTVADHIGIVETVNPDGSLNTIEGNTGVGNDSNGGEVMRRTRNTNTVLGAYRPNYEREDEEMITQEQFDTMYETMMTEKRALAESNWSAKEGYFEKAKTAGLTDGTAPQAPITREENMAILGRLGLVK